MQIDFQITYMKRDELPVEVRPSKKGEDESIKLGKRLRESGAGSEAERAERDFEGDY